MKVEAFKKSLDETGDLTMTLNRDKTIDTASARWSTIQTVLKAMFSMEFLMFLLDDSNGKNLK
jgi:hypothetical protein